MTKLTRDAVTSVLGDVDDHFAAELVGTGASVEELVEAKVWVSNDECMINSGRALATGRVGALVHLLMRAADDDAPEVAGLDAPGMGSPRLSIRDE